jgi:hypothetical protein
LKRIDAETHLLFETRELDEEFTEGRASSFVVDLRRENVTRFAISVRKYAWSSGRLPQRLIFVLASPTELDLYASKKPWFEGLWP